jgi:hypothetical protein
MRIALEDTNYFEATSSPPWGRPRYDTGCRRCGSRLAGRREKVRRETTAGVRYVVETFRCRCGADRRIRREVVS